MNQQSLWRRTPDELVLDPGLGYSPIPSQSPNPGVLDQAPAL